MIRKARFDESLLIQISINYSELKTYFKRIVAGQNVDKYKLRRFENTDITFETMGHNKAKSISKNTETKQYNSRKILRL